MRININLTASYPSLSPMLQCYYIVVTGGSDNSDDILEARGGEWRKVGTLTNGREFQGVSIVNFNDFAKYCNN